MVKWVYTFGDGKAEGSAGDRNLLGGKGANLAEMCALGLPVPPGFTITSAAGSMRMAIVIPMRSKPTSRRRLAISLR